MLVEMGKKYTSNGKPIRILCVDRPDPIFTVVGMDNNGTIFYFTKYGRVCLSGPSYDLVEVWEPKLRDWCWFWNTNDDCGAYLGRFYKIHSDGRYQSWDGTYWKNCSKFDDTPKHIKGIIQ
jgi:hypothetical protein